MRRLWILLAVVFATSLLTTAGLEAATTTKRSGSKITAKQKAAATKWAKSSKRTSTAASRARGPKWRCYRVSTTARRARPAAAARGPVVTCPAPVVNVPQQAAPVVNVPQQAAPIVNVPPNPPTVGVTVDNCYIYIVQNDQLMVIDKNTYCLKKTVPLTGAALSMEGSPGAGAMSP